MKSRFFSFFVPSPTLFYFVFQNIPGLNDHIPHIYGDDVYRCVCVKVPFNALMLKMLRLQTIVNGLDITFVWL